ncbi:MAG: hypothetical protein ACLP50_06525 [Solirubrobacteraceae bacterium]
MLDPRIYRAGLIVAVLALIVLAFSLRNQQGALAPTLPPDAFNGQNVYNEMQALAREYPDRAPGSQDDKLLAATVANTLGGFTDQFTVSTDTFSARTVDGTRELENVVAVRPGMQAGSIVVVAPRDAAGSPGTAAMSGTALLLELGRVLNGETLNRTVVLASTSGSEGTAGAMRLASTLPGPIDAVIVVGDIASVHLSQPIVIPWSTSPTVAPTALRDTLASAIAAQSSVSVESTGVGGQFAHLAFPLTLGEQAPFAAAGVPAVTLSLSGETGPAGGAPVSGVGQVTGLGRAVLETVSALESGSSIAPPSAYLLLDGKVVPEWALALFVLALIFPVAITTVDGVARARRRGHLVGRSIGAVLAAAVPFALALVVVVVARLVGAIAAAPPGPVAPGVVPLRGAGIAVLAVAGLALVVGAVLIRVLAVRRRATGASADQPPAGPDPAPAGARRSRGRSRRAREASARPRERSSAGLAAALPVVMCVVTVGIWAGNPFAALLVVPALHLWLWATDADLPVPAVGRLALVVLGLGPPACVILYYANTLGFGAAGVIWAAALLVAGHGISVLWAVEWCIVMGCAVSAAAICVLAARGSRVAPAAVTVRGPVGYAGPGSLGGTKSALRR